jgi:hypothetical protein
VFRVSSQKAADLRWFLSRHAKTNGIDADTLARLPLVSPAGLQPLELPGAGQAALDRRPVPPAGSPARPPTTRPGSRTWPASCCRSAR